jgi:hypothetical protein
MNWSLTMSARLSLIQYQEDIESSLQICQRYLARTFGNSVQSFILVQVAPETQVLKTVVTLGRRQC